MVEDHPRDESKVRILLTAHVWQHSMLRLWWTIQAIATEKPAMFPAPLRQLRLNWQVVELADQHSRLESKVRFLLTTRSRYHTLGGLEVQLHFQQGRGHLLATFHS
jgi:hypothetical protein